MHTKLTTIAALVVISALFVCAPAGAADYAPQDQTSGLTPITLSVGGTVLGDSLCRVPVYVFATDHAGDVALWQFRVTTRRIGDGTIALIQSSVKDASLGATTWTAVLTTNGEDGMQVTLTGALGVTVDWLATNDDRFCELGPLP